ncbi:MAG: S8 family serine peptidase, partial [Acidimicrobiia bacterium]|nr:S8 family serine peptidase [Acidimicrobiia bacterium]
MYGIEWRTRKAHGRVLMVVLSLIIVVASAPAGALTGGDLSGYQGSPYAVAERIGLIDGNGVAATGATGAGVTIALIDTGVVDVPGLRYSNVTIGPDFSFDDMIPDLRGKDANGHGTHLASIMVASDQAWFDGDHTRSPDRVLGIAPDADLISIKAGTADGTVDVSQVIAAINWVINQKTSGASDIDILNLSFGTASTNPYSSDPLAYAVERAWLAGIVVVVSAGNDGNAGASLSSPAYDPLVIAVGASMLAGTETEADFTSEGVPNRKIDVSAPGKSIIGLRNPGSFSDYFNFDGRIGDDLVRATGTSQAAAVVSGAVALLLEARPDLSPDQVKWLLKKTADKTKSETFGISRLLNVAEAISASVPSYSQSIQRSDGSGSLDAARGLSRLWIGGVMLEGEVDIFGNTWSGNTWSVDAWSVDAWSGNTWSGNTWSGNTWSGNTWSGNTWSGNT